MTTLKAEDPTPEQIRAACEEIQLGWTESERHTRLYGTSRYWRKFASEIRKHPESVKVRVYDVKRDTVARVNYLEQRIE